MSLVDLRQDDSGLRDLTIVLIESGHGALIETMGNEKQLR